MARSRRARKPVGRTQKSARRRVGDAAEQARFRDGVRVRAVRIPNKKKEASRRACRTTRRASTD
ncbi:MAG: hypothetical protein EBT73_05695 [Actinobacteria bacterium]|nr:hypothetical protein [Actinomycetota bacterium]NBO80531.1 hypothetical protein [Actinomycetota bacterium]NBR76816.1 hypothetical protein [Actinomycetota bacterium]NBY57478.1 hypothetical protein [Actinomycetota bacterium]